MARRFIVDDGGADLVEYALLASLIGLAGVTVFPTIITKMAAAFSNWGNNVQNIWVPCDPGVTPPC